MVRNFKRSLAILVILILVASTYAFAAANTFKSSNLGVGSDPIMGYAVSDIVYDLDIAVDPPKVAKILFKLTTLDVTHTTAGDPPAAPVFVSINTLAPAVAPVWTAAGVCGGAGIVADAGAPTTSWSVTCTYVLGTGPNVADVLSLEVLASSSLNP